MTVRLYEGDKTETGGAGIEITDNKVVNLILRNLNNLIKINSNNEVYVDLQLDDNLQSSATLPVGVTTGRVVQANGRPVTGTLISAKTTSGDVAKILYGDDGKIRVENGDGTWETLQFSMTAGTGINITNDVISNTGVTSVNGQTGAVTVNTGAVISATEPANPTEGMLWYDTTNDVLKSYDGSNWNEVGNDDADINTKTFYLSGTSDLTNAQAAYNWYLAGKNPIIVYNGKSYTTGSMGAGFMYFYGDTYCEYDASYTKMVRYYVYFSLSNDTVASITVSHTTATTFLSTSRDYSTPYTPQYDGSPATKKYVDDRVYINSSAPATPQTGQFWYDTTNSVLKLYDGSNWISI